MNGPGSGRNPTTPASAARNRRRMTIWSLAVVGFAVVGLLAWYIVLVWRAPQPADAKVVGDRLEVYDARGRVIWTKSEGLRLSEDYYRFEGQGGRHWYLVEDLDGDGRFEVLLIVNPITPAGGELILLRGERSHTVRGVPENREPDGLCRRQALRWSLARAVPLGARRARRRKARCGTRWVHGSQFPSVLHKLDARGRHLGAYWSDGHISSVVTGTYHNRPSLYVGATNNEFKGASLAVIDQTRPDGSSPSLDPEFRCAGCPDPSPLAFFVFPMGDVGTVQQSPPSVDPVIIDTAGQVEVHVVHAVDRPLPGIEPNHPRGVLLYTFNRDLRLIDAEVVDDYARAHQEFRRVGLLDHPLDDADQRRELFPVRRWNGRDYDLIVGSEIAGPRRSK